RGVSSPHAGFLLRILRRMSRRVRPWSLSRVTTRERLSQEATMATINNDRPVIKTTDDLIALFAERATRLETVYTPELVASMHFDAQARLTVNQVNWLVDLFRREGCQFPTRGRRAGTHGILADGRGFHFVILRNGAGLLNMRDASRQTAAHIVADGL